MRREHDFPQPTGTDERAERRGDPPVQREGWETWVHIGNPGLKTASSVATASVSGVAARVRARSSRRLRLRAARMAWTAMIVLATSCAPINQATRPTPAQMQGVRRLAVTVFPETEFTVVKERRGGASAAAVSGIPFGVVGVLVAAGAYSAITTAKDKDHAAAVSPHVTSLVPQEVFTASLIRTLEQSGRFSDLKVTQQPLGSGERERFDGVLEIKLPAWGLVIVARDPDLMSGFVELDVRMTAAGAMVLEEAYTALGSERYPLEAFGGDAVMTRRELTETLQVAGQRLAYELLYPRGIER